MWPLGVNGDHLVGGFNHCLFSPHLFEDELHFWPNIFLGLKFNHQVVYYLFYICIRIRIYVNLYVYISICIYIYLFLYTIYIYMWHRQIEQERLLFVISPTNNSETKPVRWVEVSSFNTTDAECFGGCLRAQSRGLLGKSGDGLRGRDPNGTPDTWLVKGLNRGH